MDDRLPDDIRAISGEVDDLCSLVRDGYINPETDPEISQRILNVVVPHLEYSQKTIWHSRKPETIPTSTTEWMGQSNIQVGKYFAFKMRFDDYSALMFEYMWDQTYREPSFSFLDSGSPDKIVAIGYDENSNKFEGLGQLDMNVHIALRTTLLGLVVGRFRAEVEFETEYMWHPGDPLDK